METKNRKSYKKAPKADSSALGSREYLTRSEFEMRYPICEEATDLIGVLKLGLDKSSVHLLTESLRGFIPEIQVKMMHFFIYEYSSRIRGEENKFHTGLFHVDRLLFELLYLFDHDTKNLLSDDH
jgi:hypothetical protein